jgi:uncharacterized protein
MTCLLVVAKAPVAGMAKTRLIPGGGARWAARVAAAALLDTLEAVLGTPAVVPVVAMTGDLTRAERGDEVATMLASCRVIPQRGNDFATRLANAHRDVARLYPRQWVFQIGMDTPQLTSSLLTTAIDLLHSADAVLGPATDGGWWGLGLRNPQWAGVLRHVTMSQPDTGARTLMALQDRRVATTVQLSDVDTMADARAVAELVPGSRFAAEVAGVRI